MDGHFHNENYRSKFGKWNTDWSGRKGPYRFLAEEEEKGLVIFPTALVPVLGHPHLEKLGPQVQRVLLIQGLHNYMYFTEVLETEAVNPVTLEIAQNAHGFDLPRDMLRDAKKIYADEAYHAYFSDDLSSQIEVATGVPRFAVGRPRFIRELERCQAKIPAHMRQAARLFFVIVSETLISSTLSVLPKDTGIVTIVRSVVADHAADEGRHHAYFSDVLAEAWSALSLEQQELIGPLLPSFILWFLTPDFDAIRAGLKYQHLTRREIEDIMDWAYPAQKVTANVVQASRPTLTHFENYGIFDNPRTLEAFYQHGLRS